MAFTYLGTLTTDLDRVRFYIHDTADSDGPLPGDANFSDEELGGLVTLEGSWQRAVAAAFEALSAAWRKYPDYKSDDLTMSSSDIADGYAKDAQEWRSKYGGGASRAGSRAVTRRDGYSSDKDNVT
jgi:hypothetical protein